MKTASRAPAYATLYPGLCEIAKRYGYTLAIHGSLLDDLDLIAVPWVEDAAAPQVVVDAIKEHCALCFADYVPAVHWLPEVKPHGRIAWKLFLDHGASVDLSVLPRMGLQTLGECVSNTGLQLRICVGQDRKVYGLGFLNSVVGPNYTWQVYAAKNEFVFVQTDDSTTPRLEYDCKVGTFTAVLSDKEEIITQISKCELSTTLSDVVKLYEDLINKE